MVSDELHYLTGLEAGQRIRDGELSSSELTEAMLTRIEKVDAELHAYATLLPDSAMAEAAEADAALAKGENRGPLHGVPIAVKALVAMKDVRTSAGMPILNVDQSRTVIVIKRSLSPGFAGIPNPLFAADNALMLFGDGKQAVLDLVAAVKDAA